MYEDNVEVAGHVAGGPGHRHQGRYTRAGRQVQQLGRRMADRCKTARRTGRLQAVAGLEVVMQPVRYRAPGTRLTVMENAKGRVGEDDRV